MTPEEKLEAIEKSLEKWASYYKQISRYYSYHFAEVYIDFRNILNRDENRYQAIRTNNDYGEDRER